MIKQKENVYYARIIPSSGIFDVCELIIRTVGDGWFVGVDKRDKRTYLLSDAEINVTVFNNRKLAIEKVKMAETNSKMTISDVYYEEY